MATLAPPRNPRLERIEGAWAEEFAEEQPESPRSAQPTEAPAVAASRPARDHALDLLRVVALSRVVLWHMYARTWMTWFAAIPIMFFVAGTLIVPGRWRYSTFLARRGRRLLLPYWVYGATVALLSLGVAVVQHTRSGFSPLRAVAWIAPVVDPSSPGWGDGWLSTHLWYLRAYLWIVLLAPLLARGARRMSATLVLVVGAVAGLELAADLGVPVAGQGTSRVLLGDAVVYGFFAALGMWYVRRPLVLPSRALAFVAGGVGAVAFGFAAAFGLPEGGVNASYPLILLSGLAWLLAVGAVEGPLHRLADRARIARFTQAVSSRSLSVYLWHPLCIVVAFRLVTAGGALGAVGRFAVMASALALTVRLTGWVETMAAPGGPRNAVRDGRARVVGIVAVGALLAVAAATPAVRVATASESSGRSLAASPLVPGLPAPSARAALRDSAFAATTAPAATAPVTSAPAASAPVTSAPAASAPVTSAPAASAPVTSAFSVPVRAAATAGPATPVAAVAVRSVATTTKPTTATTVRPRSTTRTASTTTLMTTATKAVAAKVTAAKVTAAKTATTKAPTKAPVTIPAASRSAASATVLPATTRPGADATTPVSTAASSAAAPAPAPAPAPGVTAVSGSTVPAKKAPTEVSSLPADRLQAALDAWRARQSSAVSSAIVALRKGNETWTANSTNAGSPSRYRTDRTFSVASITKTFTAALVLREVEKGKLSLDDQVPLVENLGAVVPPGVTVRTLLTHTSGLVDYMEASGYSPAATPTAADAVALSLRTPLQSVPGTTVHYANSNYLYLGLLVEQLEGRSYSKLVDELAKSAGLKDTEVDDRPALGWIGFSSGGVVSTAEDLAMWGQALFTPGKVLSARAVTLMTTIGDSNLGLGVWPACPCWTDGQGTKRYTAIGHHTGDGGMFFFPDPGVTVVAMFEPTGWSTDEQIVALTNALLAAMR